MCDLVVCWEVFCENALLKLPSQITDSIRSLIQLKARENGGHAWQCRVHQVWMTVESVLSKC